MAVSSKTVNQENITEEGPPSLREQALQNGAAKTLAAAQPAENLAPQDRLQPRASGEVTGWRADLPPGAIPGLVPALLGLRGLRDPPPSRQPPS